MEHGVSESSHSHLTSGSGLRRCEVRQLEPGATAAKRHGRRAWGNVFEAGWRAPCACQRAWALGALRGAASPQLRSVTVRLLCRAGTERVLKACMRYSKGPISESKIDRDDTSLFFEKDPRALFYFLWGKKAWQTFRDRSQPYPPTYLPMGVKSSGHVRLVAFGTFPTGLGRTRKVYPVYRGMFASTSILGSVRTVHVDLGRSSDVYSSQDRVR